MNFFIKTKDEVEFQTYLFFEAILKAMKNNILLKKSNLFAPPLLKYLEFLITIENKIRKMLQKGTSPSSRDLYNKLVKFVRIQLSLFDSRSF